MVHRNIHDEEVSEALEHENGLTVLGFKFQIVKKRKSANKGMDMLAKIANEFLVEANSKFDKDKLKKKVKINKQRYVFIICFSMLSMM